MGVLIVLDEASLENSNFMLIAKFFQVVVLYLKRFGRECLERRKKLVEQERHVLWTKSKCVPLVLMQMNFD